MLRCCHAKTYDLQVCDRPSGNYALSPYHAIFGDAADVFPYLVMFWICLERASPSLRNHMISHPQSKWHNIVYNQKETQPSRLSIPVFLLQDQLAFILQDFLLFLGR